VAGLLPAIDFSSEFGGLYPFFKNLQVIARTTSRMVFISCLSFPDQADPPLMQKPLAFLETFDG
jgi:hypothetical protein